jgi:hypothetical protein
MKKGLFVFCLICIFSCKKTEETPTVLPSSEAATQWGNMTLQTMTRLAGNTPTYGSRALGFMGLTMYECVVHGSPTHRSMLDQLSGLTKLPLPETGKTYNWVIVMNTGQASMLKNLYDYAGILRLNTIDSLELAILTRESKNSDKAVVDRSVAFGKAIAEALFEWSKTDGGLQGYLHNFDPNYVFPTGNSYWFPPIKSQSPSKLPLHPYWGKNRTFAPSNNTLTVPKIIAFDSLKTSAYYQQMDAVYQKSKNLTQEEKDIAAWWADDPTETFTPPGHSFSLVNMVLKSNPTDLFNASETYARVGMAVSDAFVNCWKTKYTYHGERPSTYIKKYIDSAWEQFWPEPPFPAFYSGHSVQSAAAATVLESLYGTSFMIIDTSHEGRQDTERRGVNYKTRTYKSLMECAQEAGYSRILGGIHTAQDNEMGLSEGKKIGQNINNLKWN